MNKRSLTKTEIEYILDFLIPQPGIPIDTANSIVESTKKLLREQLVCQKIYPDIIESLKNTIKKQYFSSLIQSGECVGVIGAQSIGEKNTQTTLNSVDWTDKVLYIVNDKVFVEPIGMMIDNILDINKKNIKLYKENNTEFYELVNDNYYIPSGNENGFNEWLKIEAVTRHLPSGKLVKVTTASGRTVIASQSKSFLVWNGEKFIDTFGSLVKIGDILPVSKKISDFKDTLEYLDINKFKGFWKGKLLKYFSSRKTIDKILLDNDFGFLIGVYLTKGYYNIYTNVYILNIENNSKKRIINFCNKYNISITNKGTYLKINSLWLVNMFKSICGYVPTFAYNSPIDFIKGLLDGYFSNTGYITSIGNIVVSTNTGLLDGISFLLTYFGIFGIIEKSEYVNILYINGNFAYNFVKEINISDFYKKNQIENINYKYNILDEKYPFDRDVYFDSIVSIEHVEATNGFVYDFTVEKTRNFNLFNGLVVADTFHTAGSGNKTVTMGVPRVEELLNATKDQKCSNIIVYMKNKHESIEEVRNTIGYELVEITFSKISKSYEIIMNKKPELWYESFKILYNDDFTKYTDCISLKIKMDVLYEYKLDMRMIASIVSKEYTDMTCVFSPDSIGQLDIFIDTSNIDLPENRLIFINSDNAKEIYIEEVVQPILYKIIICGVPGIENVYFKNDINSLETEGSNFKKVLGLSFIDNTKTISNNVWDIYNTLGIEATRQFLIEEFMSILDGINKCHIQLLVEKMTYGGTIASVSRYTMRNEDSGPFSRASFEETMDNFLKAGLYSQEETTRGVSSSIICGKRAQIGTGVCELIINVDALPGKIKVLDDHVYENDPYKN